MVGNASYCRSAASEGAGRHRQNQSLGVDVVSGATLTSFAIINGVRDALKQAGLNPADFSKKIAPQPKLTDTVEETADIVIIGAGALAFRQP